MAGLFAAARVLGGAAIGGAIGGIAGSSQTGTGQFTDVVRGALIGAGAGLATTKLGWLAGKFAAKQSLKTGWKVGKGVLGASWRMGRAALRNPWATVGVGMGGLGVYGLARSGPQDANRSRAEMAQMAELSGGPSTGFEWGEGAGTRAAFENSTMGLVQGLHRGRHR